MKAVTRQSEEYTVAGLFGRLFTANVPAGVMLQRQAMTSVRSCSIPAGAVLDIYSKSGAYTDCYTVTIPCAVTQAEFVEAFYTTMVFKLERFLLAMFISRPSTDVEANQLAIGKASRFSAWSVEQRMPDQLLLAAGSTRSWLMAVPFNAYTQTATNLYFGSAIVPLRNGNGAQTIEWQFRALLGFHRLYSRILLSAASRKLASRFSP